MQPDNESQIIKLNSPVNGAIGPMGSVTVKVGSTTFLLESVSLILKFDRFR